MQSWDPGLRTDWWNALPQQEWPSVDMVVRSHSGETSQLLLLLRSVEMYWPLAKWGVVVVLDDDPFDAALALTLPSFVRVVLEPEPPGWDAFIEVRRRMQGMETAESTRENFTTWSLAKSSKGYVRAQWSQLNVDSYSTADFIAWMDTDTVLFTYVTPSLLFETMTADMYGQLDKQRRLLNAPIGHGNATMAQTGRNNAGLLWRAVVGCGDDPPVYWAVVTLVGR
eukprot:TRINITY_DN22083_c0_g1_i6.p1 TRINITY_DN22083_c0_g1~~TRINITY_DN22083_c0_g1_i6.p1  ORF type:complete len:225 (-),score=22.99 TRINITY_DN22083_c0_g1_i6:254-928(-)